MSFITTRYCVPSPTLDSKGLPIQTTLCQDLTVPANVLPTVSGQPPNPTSALTSFAISNTVSFTLLTTGPPLSTQTVVSTLSDGALTTILSTSTPSPAASQGPGDLSQAQVLGLGIGIPVAVLLIMAIVVLVRRGKTQKQRNMIVD
ncbi:hypothetical protein EDD86DRAFT_244505 [Gorgonomyces haynaldii]|nr:hypothetical protein EDD86DRAFT_244505 [Gorgonomyces haynaldii]